MSAESWMQEHYPTLAEDLSSASDLQCATHCLVKVQTLTDLVNHLKNKE